MTATATKTSLEKWIRAASNFIALTSSLLIRQMLANVLELNSKGLYQSSGKGKQDGCFVLPSSTKREIRRFHIVVVQRRQTEKYHTKKRDHVQSCYFAKLNLLVYCRSPCRRRRRCSPWFIPGTYVSLCTESYLFIYLFTYLFIENTSWKVLTYGIYARVVDVSEIERMSAANE